MNTTIDIAIGAAGLRALQPAWKNLVAQLEKPRLFHQPEWYLSIAETLETHNILPLRCVTVSVNDDLVAVLPFEILRIKFGGLDLKTISVPIEPPDLYTTPSDLVLAPRFTSGAFLSSLITALANLDPDWDVLACSSVLEDSCCATALRRAPYHLPFVLTLGGIRGETQFLSCTDENDPFKRLSKGFRQNLRTSHNHLKSKTVTFDVASDEEGLHRLLPDLLRIESSGWKGELGTSVLQEPLKVTFFNKLIQNFAFREGCELHLMRLDGRPVASIFGVVTNRVWYLMRTAYDETFSKFSPGHLMIEHLIRRNGKTKAFDILTPYNAPLWFSAWKPDQTMKLQNAWIFRPSAKGVEMARNFMSLYQRLTPQQVTDVTLHFRYKT